MDIKSYFIDELEEYIKNINQPKFRAKQIFSWIHQKNVTNFFEMSNIPKTLQQKLNNEFTFLDLKIIKKLKSKDDTVKYLFRLYDGNMIESVFMPYSYGNAVCISTQVGCKMGCSFCASTLDGFARNLTPSEMLSQIYEIEHDLAKKVRTIVLMGSGEPFDNFENLKTFIKIINSKDGFNLGQRHITVSTCGIVEKIYDFANLNTQVNLAISLHAPTDDLRAKIMPIAKKYPILNIINACKYYSDTTKRRVTYEYALISSVNDKEEHAKLLISLLKNSLCHVNLIPINEIKENNYKKTSEDKIKKFKNTLEDAGIKTTIRRELGSDINAACGQLRRNYKY